MTANNNTLPLYPHFFRETKFFFKYQNEYTQKWMRERQPSSVTTTYIFLTCYCYIIIICLKFFLKRNIIFKFFVEVYNQYTMYLWTSPKALCNVNLCSTLYHIYLHHHRVSIYWNTHNIFTNCRFTYRNYYKIMPFSRKI